MIKTFQANKTIISLRSKLPSVTQRRVPMFVVIICALVIAVFGYRELMERWSLIRTDAAIDGLNLQIERIEWLDSQMNHGSAIPMPQSMTPDLPEHHDRRFNVDVTLFNTQTYSHTFHRQELVLRSTKKFVWQSLSSDVMEISLLPGQLVNLSIKFDVPHAVDGDLRLLWNRNGKEVGMIEVPHPPEHET